MIMMAFWERFLDSLASDGGHIVLWLFGVLLGATLIKWGVPKGEDVLVGSFTGLGIALKNSSTNYQRRNGSDATPPTETKE